MTGSSIEDILGGLQNEANKHWPGVKTKIISAIRNTSLDSALKNHIIATLNLPEEIVIPGADQPIVAPAAPVLNGLGEKFLANAVKRRGRPYTWAGDGIETFDCSALTQTAAREAGINIGRTTYDQIQDGREVEFSDVQIGDLVFSRFSTTGKSKPQHVSIWAGNGKVFEAGNPIDFYTWGNRGAVRVRRIV